MVRDNTYQARAGLQYEALPSLPETNMETMETIDQELGKQSFSARDIEDLICGDFDNMARQLEDERYYADSL